MVKVSRTVAAGARLRIEDLRRALHVSGSRAVYVIRCFSGLVFTDEIPYVSLQDRQSHSNNRSFGWIYLLTRGVQCCLQVAPV